MAIWFSRAKPKATPCRVPLLARYRVITLFLFAVIGALESRLNNIAR